jgi:hypothetical protein
MNKVINCHHFGGPTKIPKGVRYVGRPSTFGNPFASRTLNITRDEAVALHLHWLYGKIKEGPYALETIKKDLSGHDLACFCKSDHHHETCHADNLLEVALPKGLERDYSPSVMKLLIDDLRHSTAAIDKRVRDTPSLLEGHVNGLLLLNEARCSLNYVLIMMREKQFPLVEREKIIALAHVLLRAAYHELDDDGVKYRLTLLNWFCDKTIKPYLPIEDMPVRKKIAKKDNTRIKPTS